MHVAVINKNAEAVLSLINLGVNLFIEDNKRNVTIFTLALLIDTSGIC